MKITGVFQTYLGLVFLLINSPLFSQGDWKADTYNAIERVSKKEQEAFRAGDCEVVVSLMAEGITFYANGRKAPSKSMIGNFCNRIPRPFRQPEKDEMTVIPISEVTGYTVRVLEYTKDAETRIKEIVTKIWNKQDDGWKMIHLQSTIVEIPSE